MDIIQSGVNDDFFLNGGANGGKSKGCIVLNLSGLYWGSLFNSQGVHSC